MSYRMRVLLLVCCMAELAVVSRSEAATYYVDPLTGSDANAGTVCASPIAGYSKAGFLAGLVAGDMVLQKAGTTYTGQLAPSTNGAQGNPIIFGVYQSCAVPARVTDGSARAIIDGNNAVAPVISITSRTDITIDGIDVQGTSDATGVACHTRAQQSTRITVKYSTARVGNGTGKCGFTDNRGNSDLWEHLSATGMNQSGFLVYGPTGSSATDITIQDSVFNDNNTVLSASHAGIKWGPDDATPTMTRLIIRRNTCSNNGGATVGNGIRSSGSLLAADISYNTCTANKYGIYLESATDTDGSGDSYAGTVVHHNTVNLNSVAGIQSNRADFHIVEYNTANQNGSASAPNFGRGIEIVGTTANHARFVTVRFNTANGNYNYIANGTEGVGLAFDNYTDDSIMYGNYAESNEGNGIQSFICLRCVITGNRMKGNGTNFRGGAVANNAKSDLGIGSSSATVIMTNNTIQNDCTTQARYGISEPNGSTSIGIEIRNNLIIGSCLGGISIRSGTTQSHNAFWQTAGNVLNAADDTALANGTGAITVNPLIMAPSDPRPIGISPLRRSGIVVSGACMDYRGRPCWSPPDIGAYQMSGGDPSASRTSAITRTRPSSRSSISSARSAR